MTTRNTNYLTMTSATLQVLAQFESDWQTNKPAERQVAAIRNGYTLTQAAMQSSNAVSTGVTDDKEAAGDAAIDMAVRLAGYAQAYALEQNDLTLNGQMKVNFSVLDRLPDEELAPRLRDLHQRMTAIGQPLEEFGVTGPKLTAFAAAIEKFEGMKSAPRVTIATRKGHNDSIPEIIRGIRAAFAILDKLVKNWEDTNPVFVRDYFNARNIVDRGGSSTGELAPAKKTDA